jgi:hypothetical protein
LGEVALFAFAFAVGMKNTMHKEIQQVSDVHGDIHQYRCSSVVCLVPQPWLTL